MHRASRCRKNDEEQRGDPAADQQDTLNHIGPDYALYASEKSIDQRGHPNNGYDDKDIPPGHAGYGERDQV